MIVLLTGVVLLNAALFMAGIFLGWNRPIDQTVLGIWLANAFFGLALILMLYRRFFVDDVLIVKKRHPKYEDFLEKYDIE
jgi:beta-lactamase regulating signal transducer with metallopeptidase domain